MAQMSKVYDGAVGAQAPDANERSEDIPDGNFTGGWRPGAGLSATQNAGAGDRIEWRGF
jgi:hypothetical protein